MVRYVETGTTDRGPGMGNFQKVFLGAFDALWRKILKFPLDVLGYFLVPVAYLYRKRDLEDTPMWLSPWINPEDWTGGWRDFTVEDNCIPPDLQDEFEGFWGFYRYHAMRNRTHGLKRFKWHNLDMHGEYTYDTPEYCAAYEDWWLFANRDMTDGPFWHVTTLNGRYHGFEYVRYFNWRDEWYYYKCKIGWRIGPKDAEKGFNPESHRWVHGTTATFQPFEIGLAGGDYR